ncbi:hypothetical protein BJV85_001532 [Clostridium acetobutylicum]|uniref:Uncharacterized protein n=1 Tax=Clostridium acetobutylicum (strain ATCC 824 / DSM 792 / JCM 1419 / IAM 19013 / LMG 5710 / NBRC 13948 / NRRL B-527 / VKM B-1787 / 2291 / W) TaxID=272562 RepID=Q97GL3_CLOAB|nr:MULTISPECIES: hypothetical protein [Clostridium]AAK80309.1 Hypothetical protein CA_C2353 [Clostridium acetobutylicum ATCC 824]ADZ21404.1 Conserved hypothetical protein [Clostridium acetobutylicum EA 2018]AEI32299.1 hypothetical protein SMB_G2387 [Clostridium acetobutylicum DSM 1731]AWV79270.1 hypothetical protein DK921_03995 [Clostridium acetobutylicum]MBC2394761.1 hypothetical protein [Clostridium acetobutylicum]
MDELEKWVKGYSEKKGVSYQETIIKALKFYRKFVEDGKVEYYDLGKKLNEFIKENHIILSSVDDNIDKAIETHRKESFSVDIVQEVDKKEKYLKSMDNISSSLINIILSDKTIILRMYEDAIELASSIVSFENLGTVDAKYVFVHYIKVNPSYKKAYQIIEKGIADVARKFGARRIDRVVADTAVNGFKNIGYNELYRNYYLKINIDKRNYNFSEYEKSSRHHISSRYTAVFRMYPEGFEEKAAMNKLYKFTTKRGKFYAQIAIREDKASAKLYFDKNKLDKADYTQSVYYTLVNYLNKSNVKNLYTLIEQRHINVIGSIDNARKIKEWVWIRKLL